MNNSGNTAFAGYFIKKIDKGAIYRIAVIIEIFVLFSMCAFAYQTTGIDEIKPGMKGEALTVAEGEKIEAFDIEVLKIVKGDGPIKEMILIKASGELIKKTGGISEGMSGSPVFIGEKLAGCISYVIDGNKSTALVTPINDMLKLSKYDEKIPAGNEKNIKPGAAIIITPVRGDISIDTIGTLTHIDGSKVYALGHPIDNIGTTKYFLQKASVDYSIMSQNMPFKVGRALETIGVITQDRKSGVSGYLTNEIKTYKINVDVRIKGESKSTAYEMIADERVIANYLPVSLQTAIGRNIDSNGYRSAKYYYEMIDESNNIIFKKSNVAYYDENLVDNIAEMISGEVLTIFDNSFKDIRLKKVNIRIDMTESRDIAYIKDFTISRNIFKVGDTFELSLNYHLIKKGFYKEKLKVAFPQWLKPGTYTLRIYSGSDRKKEEPQFYDYESFIAFHKGQYQNNEAILQIAKKDNGETDGIISEFKFPFNYYLVQQKNLEADIIIDSFEAKK